MSDSGRRAAGDLSSYGYTAGRERSAGELIENIITHAQEIVRFEIRLAKAEIREESRKALVSGAALATGVVVVLYGLAFLLAGAVAALALVLPWWAAALIIGGVVSMAGGAGIKSGVNRLKTVHAPEKTIAEAKENVEWLKQQTKS